MSRATVAAMTAYTLELREARTKLNQNESPFDLPPDLKKLLMEQMIRRDWNRYPDFESSTLRNALAVAYGLQPENILVGNGSNELLAASISTFVGPGTPVIIPRPTFTLYEKLVTVAGGSIIWVDIDPTTGLLPLDGMVKAAKGLENAAVIVCSPNNPTGGVLPEDGLQRLLDTGATVFFDRAYGDFAHRPAGFGQAEGSVAPGTTEEPPAHTDPSNTLGITRLAKDLPPLHDRLVTFCTFSKAWAMAGLRVGWLASTAATAREIRKVKLPYSLNIVSEAAAALSLKYSHFRDRNVARIIDERERLAKELQSIAGVEVFPTWANFVAFRTARPAKEVFEQLIERGLLIRDISSYYGLAKCLRVSVGTPVENDAFLAALKEIV